jgi:drug/metabolite transporter (DMT)-like permease
LNHKNSKNCTTNPQISPFSGSNCTLLLVTSLKKERCGGGYFRPLLFTAEKTFSPTMKKVTKKYEASRTYQLLILLLLLRPLGNLSLAWGMKHFPRIVAISPLLYLRAMLNPYVAVGILLLILALLARMALLSLADLSYVLPMTAGGYVVSTALAELFLKENVSAEGWIGTLLVCLGIAVVGPASRANTAQFPNRTNKV